MQPKRWLLLLGWFATATVANGDETPITRIAFGSCNREYKPQPLWRSIFENKPDVWIWLGDIVYGDARDLPDLARRYQSLKEQPDYQALRNGCKVLGVWDDNDFGVSNGGRENPAKAESQRLLLDFLDEPPASARRQQTGVYSAYTFGSEGRRTKIILLDGRFHRERSWRLWSWLSGNTEPEADILGAKQWQWLEEQLTASNAEVHLIGSGIQVVASEHRYEKWADFPEARERLFDLIAKTQARNVIFLSGDRHLAEISRVIDPRVPYPLYDVTSSGLTHHAENRWFRNFSAEPNQHRRGANFVALNFGLIELDWESTPPLATLQIRGEGNAVALEEKITLLPAATRTAPETSAGH